MMSAKGGGTIKENTLKNKGIIINISNQEASNEKEIKANKVPTRIWFEVPDGIQCFWGRAAFLQQLHETLQQSKSEDVTTILSQVKVVSGMGGIGKTQTARKYISQYEDFYENVIWIQAETETTMKNSFLRLAGQLQIPTTHSEDKVQKIKKIVENIFQTLCHGQKSTLFVFDSADDFENGVETFLPSEYQPELKNLVILVTSRVQHWSRRFEKFQVLSLDLFTPEETLNFILQHLEIPDNPRIREETRKFIELIGGLPLALQQAVAFIKEKREQTGQPYKFADFGTDFKSAMTKFLSYDQVPGSPSTIFVTFKVTSDRIKTLEDGEAAIKILQAFAFLYADKIPLQFAQSIFSHLEKEQILRCLVHLEKYSLINRQFSENENDAFVRIHRQLQFVILQNLKTLGNLHRVFDIVLDGCGVVFQTMNYDKSADIFTNFYEFVENSFTFSCYTDKYFEFIQVFTDVLLAFGQYDKCEYLCRKVYNNCREYCGENSERTLVLQRCVALKRDVRFPSKRTPIYLNLVENILKRLTINFGENHRTTLEAQSEKAMILFFQGEYSPSSRLYEVVMEQKMKLLGDHHDSTMKTQHSWVASYSRQQEMYRRQGEWSKAIELYKQMEEKQAEILGTGHPDTLYTSYCKAQTLFELRQFTESSSIFRHVYDKRKQTLGVYAWDTIWTLDWISRAEVNQGNLEAALQLKRQVLELWTKTEGKNGYRAKQAENEVKLLELEVKKTKEKNK